MTPRRWFFIGTVVLLLAFGVLVLRPVPTPRADNTFTVTGRVIGARAMLVPSPDPRRFNEIVVGVMGRALEVSPLELCSAIWTANHYHCLLVVHDQQQRRLLATHAGATPRLGRRISKTAPPPAPLSAIAVEPL